MPIAAKLVYDQGDKIFVPDELGTPRADQLQGTVGEQLIELSGRTCYDSLGKGRPSVFKPCPICEGNGIMKDCTSCEQGYHDHIKQVGHGSVWEHFNKTFNVVIGGKVGLMALFNRPGLFVIAEPNDSSILRVTLNPRVINDWDAMTHKDMHYPSVRYWKQLLGSAMHEFAPNVVSYNKEFPEFNDYWDIAPAIHDEEKWVSMFIQCSRGCSHELVRHGDFTAISQRSTRFVDENWSRWIEHPLEGAYLDSFDHGSAPGGSSRSMIIQESERVITQCREIYKDRIAQLEPWLLQRGVNKQTARKQARGAARGYLGNALQTEMIFSANVAQWKRMLRQRATVHADAEIRGLFCQAFGELCASRYSKDFQGFRQQPSPDGIGNIVVEAAIGE